MFYAAFWVLAYALVWATWDAFLDVWRTLPGTGVMVRGTSGQPVDDPLIEAVVEGFRAVRPKLIGVAVLLSALANWLDIKDWVACYGNAATCPKQDWVDFNIAFVAAGVSKGETGIFTTLVYLQQFILGVLAFLMLLQLLFHTLAFGYFEATRAARSNNLTLRLNRGSPLNEFGLEHWNQTLNNLYWLLAIGLLIPILSRQSQPDPAILNTGQTLLQILVPTMLIAPMFLTIVMRQLRLPAAWRELRDAPRDRSAQEYSEYHAQRLWPLDKNWASKLGIIVAFVMLSYLLGSGFSDLAKNVALF